jgi:hypothetical protein
MFNGNLKVWQPDPNTIAAEVTLQTPRGPITVRGSGDVREAIKALQLYCQKQGKQVQPQAIISGAYELAMKSAKDDIEKVTKYFPLQNMVNPDAGKHAASLWMALNSDDPDMRADARERISLIKDMARRGNSMAMDADYALRTFARRDMNLNAIESISGDTELVDDLSTEELGSIFGDIANFVTGAAGSIFDAVSSFVGPAFDLVKSVTSLPIVSEAMKFIPMIGPGLNLAAPALNLFKGLTSQTGGKGGILSEGVMVRTDVGDVQAVWLLDQGKRRHIRNASTVNAFGGFGKVITKPYDEVMAVPQARDISNPKDLLPINPDIEAVKARAEASLQQLEAQKAAQAAAQAQAQAQAQAAAAAQAAAQAQSAAQAQAAAQAAAAAQVQAQAAAAAQAEAKAQAAAAVESARIANVARAKAISKPVPSPHPPSLHETGAGAPIHTTTVPGAGAVEVTSITAGQNLLARASKGDPEAVTEIKIIKGLASTGVPAAKEAHAILLRAQQEDKAAAAETYRQVHGQYPPPAPTVKPRSRIFTSDYGLPVSLFHAGAGVPSKSA